MFHGSMVALLTPMKENGEVDYPCLLKQIDWHIAEKTNAIVVMGTTGEAATLTDEEQDRIIKTVVERVAHAIPVIAGTGSNSTRKAIEKTKKAMKIGVDACLLVTPYYNCPTQEGLYRHYRSVADEVAIPQILYNVPKRTGSDILPETVERLAQLANIIGIKEGRVAQAKEIIQRCGRRMDVYSGDDSSALEIMRAGGKGVVSVAANLIPKMISVFCEWIKKAHDSQNDASLWSKAEVLDGELQPIYKSLFVETNPIPVKWLAAKLGLISSPTLRLPLTVLAGAQQEQLESTLNYLQTKNFT